MYSFLVAKTLSFTLTFKQGFLRDKSCQNFHYSKLIINSCMFIFKQEFIQDPKDKYNVKTFQQLPKFVVMLIL